MPAYTPKLSETYETYQRHRADHDMEAALINARQILELMVAGLMGAAGLPPSQAQNKNEENINILFQAGVISGETKANYHQIRMIGNRVTHNENISEAEAERAFALLETEYRKFQTEYTDEAIRRAKKCRNGPSRRRSIAIKRTIQATLQGLLLEYCFWWSSFLLRVPSLISAGSIKGWVQAFKISSKACLQQRMNSRRRNMSRITPRLTIPSKK